MEMEEEKKKQPSFPSNYVTLVQLQERWHKERAQNKVEQPDSRSPTPPQSETQVIVAEENKKKKQPSFSSNYVTLVQLQERWHKERAQNKVEPPDSQSPTPPQSETQVIVAEENKKKKKKKNKNKNKKKNLKGEKLETTEEGPPLESAEKEDTKETTRGTSRKSSAKFRASSVNTLLTKEKEKEEGVVHAPTVNGEKEDVSGGRYCRRRGIRGEIRALDQTAPIEPELRASSVEGKKLYVKVEKEAVVESPLENGEKEEGSGRKNRKGRGNRGESRAHSRNHSKPKFRASSGNGNKLYLKEAKEVPGNEAEQAPLTNGENEDESTRVNQKRGEIGDDSRAEGNNLGQSADVEPKFRALPLTGTRGESWAESNGFDQKADIEPKFRALSVNGGIGKVGDDWLRRTSAYHNRGYRGPRSDGFGRLGRREVRNAKDGSMVWVKKEEVFDCNVCATGTQKPGSSRAVSGFGRSSKRKGQGNAVA